jgi:pimeloyl-ACP methyl ester carboxylesterase
MKVLLPLLALAAGAAAAGETRSLGSLEFAPCELRSPGAAGPVDAYCATVPLPENPAAPAGRRIGVRVAWLPAASQRPEPDVVVLLAGGPGQSALEAYPAARPALRPLLRKRHVVLVEQRGTGQSNPLRCPLPDWKDPAALDAGAARAQARDCLARLAGHADPGFYTTTDYLRDLEAVRAALGGPRFNLVGGSYGTRVALEYLRRHPQAVRSVFIDSVVPPELALGQDHARNLDDALAAMARRCDEAPACRQRHGDVAATLRSVREVARGAPRPVVLRHPRTHQRVTVPFGEAALAGVVRLFAYEPRTAALLPLLLGEAAAGRPEPLLAQAELLAATLPEQLAHGLELSVLCAEDVDLLAPRPQDAGTLLGNDFVGFLRAQCEVWPRGARPADFKQPVVSDVPVLLLSGEHDPVTPPRYADQVARTLANSRHLVAKGQGHTPMNEGCMPRLLRRFVETLAPRELDAGCLDALGDTPFFLDFQGPAP